MKTILIVEDEHAIQEMMAIYLQSESFDVLSAYDYVEATQFLASNSNIDLVLLDWMLPKGSGIQLLNELKNNERNKNIPVIMLSARAEMVDKLTGLNTGADDYITKPFSLSELLARINAVLRRSNSPSLTKNSVEQIKIDKLCVDLAAHRLSVLNEELIIGRMEFKLLGFLVTHLERVYSRNQLLDYVWGNDSYIDERTVDVSVGRLRKVLEPYGYGKMLQTVRGEGYRFSLK